MFFQKSDISLTPDEKIDYIYSELKRDEQHRFMSRIWVWIWRIFLIASTFYLYLHPESIFDLAKGITGSNMGG